MRIDRGRAPTVLPDNHDIEGKLRNQRNRSQREVRSSSAASDGRRQRPGETASLGVQKKGRPLRESPPNVTDNPTQRALHPSLTHPFRLRRKTTAQPFSATTAVTRRRPRTIDLKTRPIRRSGSPHCYAFSLRDAGCEASSHWMPQHFESTFESNQQIVTAATPPIASDGNLPRLWFSAAPISSYERTPVGIKSPNSARLRHDILKRSVIANTAIAKAIPAATTPPQ